MREKSIVQGLGADWHGSLDPSLAVGCQGVNFSSHDQDFIHSLTPKSGQFLLGTFIWHPITRGGHILTKIAVAANVEAFIRGHQRIWRRIRNGLTSSWLSRSNDVFFTTSRLWARPWAEIPRTRVARVARVTRGRRSWRRLSSCFAQRLCRLIQKNDTQMRQSTDEMSQIDVEILYPVNPVPLSCQLRSLHSPSSQLPRWHPKRPKLDCQIDEECRRKLSSGPLAAPSPKRVAADPQVSPTDHAELLQQLKCSRSSGYHPSRWPRPAAWVERFWSLPSPNSPGYFGYLQVALDSKPT